MRAKEKAAGCEAGLPGFRKAALNPLGAWIIS